MTGVKRGKGGALDEDQTLPGPAWATPSGAAAPRGLGDGRRLVAVLLGRSVRAVRWPAGLRGAGGAWLVVRILLVHRAGVVPGLALASCIGRGRLDGKSLVSVRRWCGGCCVDDAMRPGDAGPDR
jgi:hypothetical protein